MAMTLREVQRILDAEVLCGEDKLDAKVDSGAGCDLVSDLLAFVHENSLLLTGLTNLHIVTTAEMIDARGIVFVRGKKPAPEVVWLAAERGIPLLSTGYLLYESCGRLYSAGLPGCRARDVKAGRGSR